MIISHKHKFIFLKTTKTASTSVEIALSKFCGADDIITPISPPDEKKRAALGYRGAQNYKFSDSDVKFYNHNTASFVKNIIDNEIWNSYYKFCVERNPWERVISHYYWTYRNKKTDQTISEFINLGRFYLLKKSGYFLYTINNEIVVDKICLYENLQEDLDDICINKFNFSEKLLLPHAKGNIRKNREPYQKVLNQQDIQRIGDVFAKEITLFKYDNN